MSNLDRAIEIVQKAIDEDLKKNYAEAYKQYQNSLDYFTLAMRYERNEKSRALIRGKINEYVTRAESLKEHLVNEEKKKAVVANDSGGSTKTDGSTDPELNQAIVSEAPTVKWDDVAGLEGQRRRFQKRDSSSNLDRAIEIVQKAIDEDLKQNYAEAYKQYRNSLDYFTLVVKYEKNEKSRALIRGKINEYNARAESLKEHLINLEKKAMLANGSGGSTNKNGSATTLWL